MNQAIQCHDVQLKTFRRAKIEDIRYYVVSSLRAKSETLILHSGSNNLKNENEERFVNKIIEIAVNIKKRVANIAVARIVFRADLQIRWNRR